MTTTLIHLEKSVNTPLEILKALANDVRFEIISILAQRECCVCDLEVLLHMNQSKVSYHLAILRDVSLILSEQRGKNSYYRLERKTLYQLGGQMLEALLQPRPDFGLTHQTESMC
jgi:ArsR family transcriptional regulator, arsenate/arsenite/antimonite-responsive transcriptional repressor